MSSNKERDGSGRFISGHKYIQPKTKKALLRQLSNIKDNWKTNKKFQKHIGNASSKTGALTKYRKAHNNFKGVSNPFYGKTHTIESIQKIRSIKKPTSLEKRFTKIFKENNMPYKYVGDGNFWIGRCNPDFVNCNGHKIAIEVFADFWHKKSYEKKRKKELSKFGWDVLFFRIPSHADRKLNESEIVRNVKEFERAIIDGA